MTQAHGMPEEGEKALVKIVFELPEDDWHTYARESLWAESLGDGQYRIRNIPFAVYGYSYDDIVLASEEDGEIIVKGPQLRGGHSTFRIFLEEGVTVEDPRFIRAWQPLKKLGCTLERATQRLLAIDVPPRVDITRVYSLLEEGKHRGLWDREEGHRGHV